MTKMHDFAFGNLGQESFDKNGPEKNEKESENASRLIMEAGVVQVDALRGRRRANGAR